MGILNTTPDSFSDGGKYYGFDAALARGLELAEQGAGIIDVGGESTRPGSKRITTADEIDRVVPLIEKLRQETDTPVSIDTSKAEVAKEAVKAGASIINDVSGLTFDADMAEVVAESGAGLVLMHLKGNFETMHEKDHSLDIIDEVSAGFERSLSIAESAGIDKDRICLDIGIGFSKTLEQSLRLLRQLREIKVRFQRFPMLVGVSRKSFIGLISGENNPEKRLPGSLAAGIAAVAAGADILRVHDVSETVQALKVLTSIGIE
ncbi:MAG: dihydropteroate synthase [Pyrinomonadaceae bacterium]|nr:dihydropteroate synthase [Pyrinomonadaceae bacterium]